MFGNILNPINELHDIDIVVNAARRILGAPVELFVRAQLKQWYSFPTHMGGKSISRPYLFNVSFIPNATLIKKLKANTISLPPLIRAWYIKNIVIPKYNYRSEPINYGAVPRTITVASGDALPTVKITFEDDNIGSVQYFEQWLQRTVINGMGVHNPPVDQKLFHIMLLHYDTDGYPIGIYLMRDCGFSSSGDITFDYGTEEAIQRVIEFNCDKLAYINTAFWGLNSAAVKIFSDAKGIDRGISKKFTDDLTKDNIKRAAIPGDVTEMDFSKPLSFDTPDAFNKKRSVLNGVGPSFGT